MKIAYCDCFSGISGDMFLGALLDAGLSLDFLLSELGKLSLPCPYTLKADEVHKGAVRGISFSVNLNPDEDPAYRHLADIRKLIQESSLSEWVKGDSLRVFTLLAEAEAAVHGSTIEEVHFHEVGAVDSIVDIVGTVIGLESLGIEQLYASALPLGSGTVHSAHGWLPLPAPATLEIIARGRIPTHPWPTRLELVTPTGAALLAALSRFEQPPIVPHKIGVGAGKRDFEWPNIFRLWVGEGNSPASPEMVVLETNIDDMNPEFFSHIMARLFEAGGRDVYMTPIYMKKNRPGTQLSIIAKAEDESRLAGLLLSETSTFGVRVQKIHRYEAERQIRMVATPYGNLPVKLKILQGKPVSAAPEYEACAQMAVQTGLPIHQVYQAALEAGLKSIHDYRSEGNLG
jgi:pyridinium-3,5-bisthiocarboxylic acid mononucleotide nickel chelatase